MSNQPIILQPRTGGWISRLILLGLAVLFISSCATQPYHGSQVESSSFLSRSITREEGDLIVSAAVPDADETRELTKLDLYKQGIQPVWLKIENRSNTRARAVIWSIDEEYFSPIEVAYMNRKRFSKQGYADMEKWFHENGLVRFIPAGETRSGFVFTHLRPGTKGFNLVVLNNQNAANFTFFVPLPGFVADFMEVDFAHIYDPAEIRDLDNNSLRDVLENELSCCALDPAGEQVGGPFNTVLVGTGLAVRRAMLRGGWLETSTNDKSVEWARQQHFEGRSPDAIFSQSREDGNEKVQLNLWMAPYRVASEPVWVGQVFYHTEDNSLLSLFNEETIRDSKLLSRFVEESVSADIDSAQHFLLQNLWYNGSLQMAGYVEGVGAATMENPRTGFYGAAYFTDGYRLVVFVSEESFALDEGKFIYDTRQKEHPQVPDQ